MQLTHVAVWSHVQLASRAVSSDSVSVIGRRRLLCVCVCVCVCVWRWTCVSCAISSVFSSLNYALSTRRTPSKPGHISFFLHHNNNYYYNNNNASMQFCVTTALLMRLQVIPANFEYFVIDLIFVISRDRMLPRVKIITIIIWRCNHNFICLA